MDTKKSGKLIVIEGADGSGKATQTKLLCERLQNEGLGFATLDFPQYDNNLFGGFIRECLQGKHGDFIKLDSYLASLPYLCDRFESKQKIENPLKEGKILVLDRYVSANQIHQGGKIRDDAEREKFLQWIDRAEHDVFGLPRPDLVIFLDVPIETVTALLKERIIKEGGARDLVEENTEYLLNSQQAALRILTKQDNWTSIQCSENGEFLSREVIAEKIWDKVKGILK